MLKPERVTFSADDEQFHQFHPTDQLDTYLNDSLVHYSTDFKKFEKQEVTSIPHSNSFNELSLITMSNFDQQTEHESAASAPPSLLSEQVPSLNENHLHQLDALALQQLAVGSTSNTENSKSSPAHSTSLAEIQKEIDRVKQMRYSRTFSSPTSSSFLSRFSGNAFSGPTNNNIDLSALTHSVHFNEQDNQTNRLPFTSTFITSIPESIVPASGISSTNDNHFIPIHHLESPSLEDREVFETFHTKQTPVPGVAIRQSTDLLGHPISTPENDLLTSLHRSASKQALDNQSDHGTTYSGVSDDMIFVEWDKERSLFQDYINSLRSEIRVLLQERAEYQKQMETINNNLSEHKQLNLTQIHSDQSKFDLLQKSLEEKNLVLEQLQREYEAMKEKNGNLTRKVSNLRCDGKAQTGVIDELKQKIAELTVDIQNHVLVKRRLEISMMNLEGDCKIIDAERLRLNNEIKETNASKQELEKLLQQAHVQIAEQGTTIEMLRSDNIQIRSQLSTTQRRMLQEKQQVMDYLRRIENDLVEKEQIKQRESILRKDYEKLQSIHQKDRQEIEQFNWQINQDRLKLNQLEQERAQLLKTIQTFDEKQTQAAAELDSYKSATKRLYTHLKVPFDSIQSIDQLIPMLEDRYRTEQIAHARIHQIPLVQSTPQGNNEQEAEEIRRLQEEVASTNMQLKQLDEANRAWQQYQQNQLVLLRDRLKLTDMENSSFEDIVQQIEHRFNDLNDQLIELQDVKKTDHPDLDSQLNVNNVRPSRDTQTEDNGEYQHERDTLYNNQYEEELRQLRENLANLTAQCAQLDEANRAWQLFHQTEVDSFRNKLQNSFPIENNLELNDIAQNISAHLDQLRDQRESLTQKLESVKDDRTVLQAHLDTINELNRELGLLKQQNDQLETEKYTLNQQLEKQSLINDSRERSAPSPDSTTSDARLVKKLADPVQIHETQIHHIPLAQSASPLTHEHEQELQQLRQNITLLTNQCTQLDQANQAWHLYQQSQLNNFRKAIQDHLLIDDNASLEQAAQQIADQITKERNSFTQQYLALEKFNEELRSESANNMETIDELNQELLATKEKHEQTPVTSSSQLLAKELDEVPLSSNAMADQEEIRQLRERIESLTAQLDESNRAWKQTQQAQVGILRNQLENCLPIDYDGSFDEIAQQIAEEVNREREDFHEKYQALERANNELRSHDNTESIRQSYMNTVNELNQELLAMKEAYDQLDREKQGLSSELEKQSAGKTTASIVQNPFEQVPIHTIGANFGQETDEVRQLRENVATLTAQCGQLDAANRAWQQYQQTQVENFRTKLQDYLPADDNSSFDEIAQQIIDQMTKEREDFSETNQALERTNNDRQSYMNTVHDLNQKLLEMKEAFDQLDAEKQALNTELEKRAAPIEQPQVVRTAEKLPSDLWKEPFREVPIHSSSADAQQQAGEIQQLRENVVTLTTQLDAANRSWQQYQQTQLDNFRTKLHSYIAVNETASLDDLAQQIVDQTTREREDFSEKYQALERAYNDLQSHGDIESIRQSYVNTVNELSQELLATKEAYNELDAEKQILAKELEKQSSEVRMEPAKPTSAPQKSLSDLFKTPFAEVPIHTSSPTTQQDSEELRQLREKAASLTAQCAQLDEANRAWQQYQRTQVDNLRNQLIDYVPVDENTALDEFGPLIVNQIEKERQDTNDRFQAIEKTNDELRSESANNLETIKQSYTNTVKQLNDELFAIKQAYEQLDAEKQGLMAELEKRFAQVYPDEVLQLQESFAALTAQCTQLDAANQAWRQYQQTQVDNLRNQLIDYLPIDENASLDEFGQLIVGQIVKEREEFNDRFQEMEKTNDELRSESMNNLETIKESYVNAVNELNQELLAIKEAYNQVDAEKQDLITELENRPAEKVSSNLLNEPFREVPIHTTGDDSVEQLQERVAILTAQCAQLDEVNRAWQLYQQTQADNFRSKLQDYLLLDENTSFDEIPQQFIDRIEKERQDFNDRFQAFEKTNEELRSESTNTLEATKQSYMNTIDELNEELLEIKEAYEQLDREKQGLLNQLEKRTTEKVSPDLWKESFREVPIHTSSADAEQQAEEIRRLRENVEALTARCAQLDAANLAWQQYQQAQMNNLRNKFVDYLPVDENVSLDEFGQQIVDQIVKEREEFDNKVEALEKVNEELRSESTNNLEEIKQSYLNTINELNQELLATKEAYDQLDKEKVSPDLWKESFREVAPIHTSSADTEQQAEEIRQLRENVDTLTAQCAQLDAANQAWLSYQQMQADNFRSKLHDHLPIDENASLDEIAQLTADQLTKEREDFTKRYGELEKVNEDLRSESMTNLETIKQSHVNTINELNQELLAMKEAYDQLDTEKQVLMDELEKRPINLSDEVPLQTSDGQPDNEELEQLRENFALLSSQYDQLNEANQAWQGFHQSQIDNFRTKVQDYIQLEDELSFDQIAEQIIDQITKDREDFAEQYQVLETTNQDLQSESIETNKNYDNLKEQYDEVFREKEMLMNQIETQERDKRSIDSTNSVLLEKESETSQLRQTLARLRETDRSWEEFKQTHFDLLKALLPSSTKTSLEEIIQETILHVQHLTEEIDSLKETQGNLQDQYEELLEKQTISSSFDNQIEQNLAALQSQYTQLENANRAWQIFCDNQIDLLKTKFEDYIQLDENPTFEQIIQSIVTKLDSNENELLKQQVNELQEANNSLMNNNQNLTYRLNQLGRPSSPFASQGSFKTARRTPVQDVQIHESTPVQSASSQIITDEEVQQLRTELSDLKDQCAQLAVANGAWQQYHQDQLDLFRKNLENWIFVDDNASLEQIGQQIIHQLDQLGRKKQNDLDSNNQSFEELNQQLLNLQRECEELREQNAKLNEKDPGNENSDPDDEIGQLRNDLAAASAHCLQLDEANRAWHKFQQDQVESFRQNLQEQIPPINQMENSSLDSIAQQIISYVNQLNSLRDNLVEQNDSLQDEIRLHRQESMTERPSSADGGRRMFRRISQDKQTPTAQIHNVPLVQSASPLTHEHEQELQQLRQNITLLTNQCAQLDQANQAWQLYQQSQLNNFRKAIQDHLPIDDNASLEQAAQQIADQITKERNSFTQQYLALEKFNEELRSESANNMETIDELNEELLAMKEKHKQTADTSPSQLPAQELDEVPLSSNAVADQEEIRQLRENLVSLTAQLDAANNAWQEYQRTQADNFRSKLQDYLAVDDSASFDDIAQQIIDQITKEREDFIEKYGELEKANDDLRAEATRQSTEQPSVETVDELTDQLANLRNQYEELEKINQQLLLEKEDLSNQLNDRSIVVGHHSALESSLQQNETPIESKYESELQSSVIPVETEEIRQLRSDLASLTSQLAESTEANENELNSFRQKLQNWLSLSPDATLDEIAEQLNDQFEQHRQQQIPPETAEIETQTIAPSEQIHIAIETTPISLENHHTQMDPIDTIDQQIQTDSLLHIWSISNEENGFTSDDDDHELQDYIDEITSLSPLDLSHRLRKECEQILSKQNFRQTSPANLELNHLALITIYSLYHQHLTDDAKLLYKDTVMRALNQEYELINSEKNDYMEKYLQEVETKEKQLHQLQNQCDELLEQNELERLHSKQSLEDLTNSYEFKLYNLHQENETLKYNLGNLQENNRQNKEQNYEELENEYRQLREDYNELINQNEVLKDINSQMYQMKLQTDDPDLSHQEIQPNPSEENQPSAWENDWDEEEASQDAPVQEQTIEKPSNEEEINRLKAIIDEIQLENQALKELNSAAKPVSIDNHVQTEQPSSNADIVPKTEDNDWNAPFEEPNRSSVVKQTIDNETQTEEQQQQQDKLAQVNTKLKRALQTIKDKIHQAVIERPELFPDVGDDTIERLDYLILAAGNQAGHIDLLNNEYDNLRERNAELENDTRSNVTSTSRTNEMIDNETQTDEQSQDKLAQVNTKLKRVLQNIKDKVHQAVIERPELFPDIADDTIERLDHLISIIGNQAVEIDRLQNEFEQAQQEINQLHSSLEAAQYQIENERSIKTESLVSAASPLDDISRSTVEEHDEQIKQLQQKLSQNEDERSLLRERLNEVELEFRKAVDDQTSTTEMYEEQLQSLVHERNALVEQQAIQSTQCQHEIEQLQGELAHLKQTPVTSSEDVQSLQEIIQQQAEEMKDLSEKYFDLAARLDTQDELDKQRTESEERSNNYENQIAYLIREHKNLLDQVEKQSSSSVQTMENESQTDDQPQEKLVQVNNKLKRVLQGFKEKLHRLANERPDLFVDVGQETNERFDHLISTVEYQAAQIGILQTEHEQSEEQLRNEIQDLQSSLEACQDRLANESAISTEQLVTAAPPANDTSQSMIEDYEKQIKQLQQKLSQNEDERSLLRERLDEVELEFRKIFDDRESTTAMYEAQLQSLLQERNALVEEQAIRSAESQHQIEQLQELKQLSTTVPVDSSVNEEIQSLKDEIEEKSEELKNLSEKYFALSSQMNSYVNLQTEFDRLKMQAEARLTEYETLIENLTRERAHLLEEVQKNAPSPMQTAGDQQQDKLMKINTKLKRALQIFKEKINRIVTDRPELFVNIGEETTERLEHLISIVGHQAEQWNALQTERSDVENQLRNEIQELQGSVEAYRYQIENERPIRSEQLVTAAPPSEDISRSIIEDYEKQIKQLQQKLSQNEDERSLLRERLNEVELEFRRVADDQTSTTEMYEEQLQSLVHERNALVEQQAIQSTQSQHEIEQMQEELSRLKQSENDVNELNEIIEQQSEQLTHLNEKYIALSSQVPSQAELDRQKEETVERLTDYENQIENLTRERNNLLEEIRKNASSASTTDNEKPTTGDQQQDKLMKLNAKLKRALQIFKEKINRIVTDRPDLFVNIGEETTERLDHLISTVGHQAEQFEALQAERNEIEDQLQNKIHELQNTFDSYRQQIDNENRLRSSPAKIQPLQTSSENTWNDWSMDPPERTETKLQRTTTDQEEEEEEPSVANRLFGFIKNVTSSWTEETPTNDWDDQHSPLQIPSDELRQTISSPSSADNLFQLIKNKIQQIISEHPNLFPHSNEDVLDNLDQFTSVIKNLQNQLEELQNKSLLDEQPKPLESGSTSSEQRISRRVFEREMLAWSKESERLKQFVKQIQIENKKLRDIILKFEPIVRDYLHENERLKQENQQLLFLSSSSEIEDSTLADRDICYLTLKWLTYEVAQRTTDNHEQSSFIVDDHDVYLRQRLIDVEQQVRSLRIQNQKLKRQLETYTVQFKHIQHEMNAKNQEISTLKSEIEKLRTSETQYRLEVDRLKADLQCDEVKFQHLERQLTDLQFERTNLDETNSTNNLRELLDLKERELNALKEKLDYTIQAHQLELQEAIKANQFSLDNVQRFEQMDERHQEKRKELEKRLGKMCKIVRPLIDNQYLFREESMIDIDELQQLITDTEAEEKVINSLGPIRDCLGLLENQMKELHDNLLENHARRSKKSKFQPWDLTSQFDTSDTSDFFTNSLPTNSIENDVRLCLDDILYDIIVRTTMK